MKKNLSRHVFVGIMSCIFVIVYLSNCMHVVFAMYSPDKLVQKVVQNLTSQKGVLVEFIIPLRNLEPLYSEFFDRYQLNKAQSADLINIVGWIFYEKETRKVSFQLGLKHATLDTFMVEYEGYYDENNVYFYNTCEVNPKRYVIYVEGNELISTVSEKIKTMSEEMISGMANNTSKPRLLYKNNSATIVALSSIKILSRTIPFSIEIDEQFSLKKINFYLDCSNIIGHEVAIEPTISMDISTEIKEVPTFNSDEVIRLEASELVLPLLVK